MLKPRWLAAAFIIAISALQAWDSHVLQAAGFVQAIVAFGILLPAAALFSRNVSVRTTAVFGAIVLMMAARVVSDVRLPELGLVPFFPAIVLWIDLVSARRTSCAAPR